MVNKKRLIKLTQDLIRINSENPPGHEEAIASFVAAYLRTMGYRPRIIRFAPHRDNVLCVLKGEHSRRPLLITPHLDTVPAGKGWTVGAFSGSVHSGRIFGRGATDCKGNLAVALEVLRSLTEEKVVLRHDLIFLATADEETGSALGLLPFLERNIIRPAFALVLDSDEFNIITSQKGLMHFKVKVSGRKAHGAYPERGVNAIDGAVALIALLKKIHFRQKPHKRLKPLTLNIGVIRGGDKVNMVADWCEFEADLRFLPGMKAADILAEIRGTFDQTGIRYAIAVNDIQQPYETSDQHPLVRSLQEAARGVTRRCRIKGSEGATVITFFKKKKIAAVATGYGSSGCAHATDEYARTQDLYKGALVLERFIKIFDCASA